MKKRWKNYQADNQLKGYNLTVAELTETQAKDELCDAMDLIMKMMNRTYDIIYEAQRANYATK